MNAQTRYLLWQKRGARESTLERNNSNAPNVIRVFHRLVLYIYTYKNRPTQEENPTDAQNVFILYMSFDSTPTLIAHE